MAFDIEAALAEEAGEPYEIPEVIFRAAGIEPGGTWRVPHVHMLTLRQQRAMDGGQIVEVLRQVGERLDGEEWVADGDALAEKVLDMRPRQVGALQAAWLSRAGLAPGESKGSSTS